MNRSKKEEKIGIILDRLYPDPPIPLEHSSAYTLLVAVMLSAQTTDKMVNKVTPQLFKKANTPELMATLEVETIQKLIQKNIRVVSMLLYLSLLQIFFYLYIFGFYSTPQPMNFNL